MECNPIFKRQPVRAKSPTRQILFVAVIVSVFLLHWFDGKTLIRETFLRGDLDSLVESQPVRMPGGPGSSTSVRKMHSDLVQTARGEMEEPVLSRKVSLPKATSASQALPGISKGPGKTGETVDYGDLPRDVRESLRLDISMMVYSTRPGRSSIVVNGVQTFEGQVVKAGLNLEKVTPEGAVFEYQGWLFRKGVGVR